MFRSRAFSLTRTGLFAAILSVCAMLAVPLPLTAVPVSLLTLGLFLAGGLLPPKEAFAAALLHLLLGTVGLPVFSGMTGGAGVLLGPTGGFLLTGPASAALMALLLRRRLSPMLQAAAMSAGLLTVYLGGMVWYSLTTGAPVAQGLLLCVLPFVPADLLKLGLALAMLRPLRRLRG